MFNSISVSDSGDLVQTISDDVIVDLIRTNGLDFIYKSSSKRFDLMNQTDDTLVRRNNAAYVNNKNNK
jgi:TolB-like protein